VSGLSRAATVTQGRVIVVVVCSECLLALRAIYRPEESRRPEIYFCVNKGAT